MATIGVLAAEHVAVGLIENHQLTGALRVFPRQDDDWDYLGELPPEEMIMPGAPWSLRLVFQRSERTTSGADALVPE